MHLRTPLRVGTIMGTLLCLALVVVQASETITATAHVTSGAGTEASAPVSMTVERFSTDAARDELIAALKSGGTGGVRDLLSKKAPVGSITVGSVATSIKYVYARPIAGGRLITAVTDKPIVYLGAGLPNARPQHGFDLGLVLIEVPMSGPGHGELMPAAMLRLSEQGALVTDDYAGEVVRLSDVIAK